jgi:hypothetical protein
MPTLRPFRDYDEKDVINFYTPSGVTIPFSKGTLVKIAGNGLRLDEPSPNEMLGNMGDFSVNNTVLQRYGVVPKMTVITAPTDPILGMTLFDVREVDENGIPLKYNPRKAAEMEACISGQAVPVVTRGIFSYSGVITGNGLEGAVGAGVELYPLSGGLLTTQSYSKNVTSTSGDVVAVPGRPIARTLGSSVTPVTGVGDNTVIIWFDVAA